MTCPIPGRSAWGRPASPRQCWRYRAIRHQVGATHEYRHRPPSGPASGDADRRLGVGQHPDGSHPGRQQPTPRGRIGSIVLASLAVGLLTAVALVAAPFIPARVNVLSGVVLLGFAFGWALLTVLSMGITDQPQRWAAAPAVFLALAGVVSLLPTCWRTDVIDRGTYSLVLG
jgi:hypothetical protein